MTPLSTCRSRCRRPWRDCTCNAFYAPNGPFGAILDDWFQKKVGFTSTGVVMALIFVGLPFVVPTVEPVLEEIDRETEEVALTLGAQRWRTVDAGDLSCSVPRHPSQVSPLSFARGVGEYGSVIFIASTFPSSPRSPRC